LKCLNSFVCCFSKGRKPFVLLSPSFCPVLARFCFEAQTRRSPQPPPHFLSRGSLHPLGVASFACAARDRKSVGAPSTPLLSSLTAAGHSPAPQTAQLARAVRSAPEVAARCGPPVIPYLTPFPTRIRAPPGVRLELASLGVTRTSRRRPIPYLRRRRHPGTLPGDP
jgi:hypothetical protein